MGKSTTTKSEFISNEERDGKRARTVHGDQKRFSSACPETYGHSFDHSQRSLHQLRELDTMDAATVDPDMDAAVPPSSRDLMTVHPLRTCSELNYSRATPQAKLTSLTIAFFTHRPTITNAAFTPILEQYPPT